ncbi:MAG: CPBP family intramembrane glutamic endopeptidase [Pseudomonadota bacterium]
MTSADTPSADPAAADNVPARPWPFAAAAMVLAMLANDLNADVLRAGGVNSWFEGFSYGWPLLLNTLDLAAVALALWALGGVGWPRQWTICGLAKPFAAPALFGAILFVPAFASLWIIVGPASNLDAQELLFGGLVFPFYEEVIFRGLAIGVLMMHFRWPFLIAALVPSLFFGAFHMYQGDSLQESLGIALITGIGSVWFGWIYWKWDFNLWPAIWLHAGLNTAWALFALGDNAMGGELGNAVRIAVIAGSIALTHWAQPALNRLALSRPARKAGAA